MLHRDEALSRWAERSAAASAWLDKQTERVCAALVAVMLVDVGLGIFGRYVVPLPVTWTEELARYLMIWVALLAISCGVARREHIAVTMLFQFLPAGARSVLGIAFDALAFAFFGFLFYFGLGMTADGASQYATIFGMTMVLPYAAVPVSAALACIQLALSAVRDFGRPTAATEVHP